MIKMNGMNLEEIEGYLLRKQKKKRNLLKKSHQSDFIIPNKPMYRIFEIDDMERT